MASDPFVLKVMSWLVRMFPHTFTETNDILCSDKKKQGPETQLLSEIQALAKRRGLVTLPRSVHIQHPIWVLLPGSGPGRRGWQCSQAWVPRPCVAIITGKPMPRTAGFSFKLENHLWQIPVRLIPSSQQLLFFENSPSHRRWT